MIPILTSKEMYSLDSHLINNIGFESKLLMESAAIYISSQIKKIIPKNSKILILCGIGNNGGDGLAISRHLMNNYDINFTLIGNMSKQSEDNKYNYNILKSLKIKEIKPSEIEFDKYTCIIDGLLGIGSKPPLDGDIVTVLNKANNSSCLRIAIDVPTGLNVDNGIAHSTTFLADYTFTMYAEKTGHYLNDGKDFCGEIIVIDLGIPNKLIESYSSISKYNNLLQIKRKYNSSKFDYGKCVVIAGSEFMSGAAALTCNSAISAGAGLVYLITTKRNQSLFSEIITYEVNELNKNVLDKSELTKLLENCNSIVIGPGLGKSKDITQMISSILSNYPEKRYIIDADGISALDCNKSYNKNITITPHIGEFANLINLDRIEIECDLVNLVKETALTMNINIILKGSTTIISNGEEVILVTEGVPEMATAGSGDVLSGILGAQINLNQKIPILECLANGVLTHITAAKYILNKKNHIIASDIIKGLQCIE